MPLLDVTDLLTDPDFATVISIIRTTQVVNSSGKAQNTTTTIPNVTAIVQPGTGQALVLLNDGSRISDSIAIHAMERLLAASPAGVPADMVIWKNNKYIVKLVSDWSDFGVGFYSAMCEFIGVNP